MARSQHFFLIAILASLASAAPLASFSANVFASNSSGFSQEQNGLDAQKLNAQFATLSANDSCTSAFPIVSLRLLDIDSDGVLQVVTKRVSLVLLRSAWETPGSSRLALLVYRVSHFLWLQKLALVSLVTPKLMLRLVLLLPVFREVSQEMARPLVTRPRVVVTIVQEPQVHHCILRQ